MAEANNGTTDTTATEEDTTGRQQLSSFRRSPIRVLHVDDSLGLVEANRRYLEQYDERIVIDSAQNAAEGADRLANREFDCLVSDYNMPGTNGVEFLKTIRESQPNLPFILYTNTQSETVMTEALSAGVSDYVQKQGGTAHLKLLANKIVTAVESRRARKVDNLFVNAVELTSEGVGILDQSGQFVHVNEVLADDVGTSPEELIGTSLTSLYQDIPDICGEQDVESTDDCECMLPVDDGPTTGEYVLVSAGDDGFVLCQA